jgi:serine/threonine-protein kinase TNNI3K
LADDEGNTALHFAAKTGHSSSLALLLEKAANGRRQFALKTNLYGDTALHSACYMGRMDAAKQLLGAAGSEVLSMVKLKRMGRDGTLAYSFIKENLFSETPLMAACTAGRFDLVCFLLRQPEVDPNYQAQDGHTGAAFEHHSFHSFNVCLFKHCTVPATMGTSGWCNICWTMGPTNR